MSEETDRLRKKLVQLQAAYETRGRRLEEVQAIVDELPKTEDGVPVVEGMELFRAGDGTIESWIATMKAIFGTWSCNPTYCSSTYEAAEAARKEASG